MISDLKKYLVIGKLKTINLSCRPDTNWIPAIIGPFVEEVWALDAEMAKQEWLRKVNGNVVYVQEYDIEIRKLFGLDLLMKEE